MKIDIHTHILPREIPPGRELYGYGGFIELDHHAAGRAKMMRDGEFFREVEANCWDPLVRIRECDEAGVDVQVLSTVPVMFAYWAKPEDGWDWSRRLNDDLVKTVAASPGRFIGLGTLPMQSPGHAVRELERCVRQLGFPGVQIGTNVNGVNLDDPSLFPIFEAAEALNAAVFVHPWEMCGRDRMKKYWTPWLVGMPAETSLAICSMIFGGVLERLPRLRVAFAHGGGAFPATIGRIDHGFEVRPDLCAVDNKVSPREYLRRIWYDSLVHDPLMLRYMVDLVGADRLALGTDYPFPLGELEPGLLIESSEFDEATKNRMLWSTAFEWLGVEETLYRKG
jgi:aminocarboxymuconate-semialdehyde decarboxylase